MDFVLVTGLRASELIALDFGDVDFGRCRVSITKRYSRGFDVPKSAYGIREVPITAELARRLWAARKERQARDSDPLFASPRGERFDYANLYPRILKPAMRKAGIPWGGAHRLRHTSATHLIRKGASANQAQRRFDPCPAHAALQSRLSPLPGPSAQTAPHSSHCRSSQ